LKRLNQRSEVIEDNLVVVASSGYAEFMDYFAVISKDDTFDFGAAEVDTDTHKLFSVRLQSELSS